jgi:hypothetical protein
MAFLLPFLPAIAGAIGTGAVGGAASYGVQRGLKEAFGFQKGGVIQGKKGSKQLIVAHGGEMILPVPVVDKVKKIMKRKGQKTTLPKANRPKITKQGVKNTKPKGRKKKK